MNEERNQQARAAFNWVKRDEILPEIYGNFIHVSWTLFDVRLQLGRLIPSGVQLNEGFVVEQQGAVTLPWPEVKILRDMLIDSVKKFEDTNGEIKPLRLPPSHP